MHNVNCISKNAESDQCDDETTWGHGGFGEAGSGLVGRIMGKPGVSKGGHIVMVSDVTRVQPRAYLYWHKLHEKPTVWMASGLLEVRRIMEKARKMVMDGEDTKDGSSKKIPSKGAYYLGQLFLW